MDQEPETNKNIPEKKTTSPIARLVQMGRNKSFVTFKDILEQIPAPEKDLDELDRAFASLLSAGIPIVEEEKLDRDNT